MKLIIVLLMILVIILLYKSKETFIYKMMPGPLNSNSYKDIGILKNIRKNRSFYAIKNEYTYKQINKILKGVVSKNVFNNLDFVKSNLKLPSVALNILLSKKRANDSNYSKTRYQYYKTNHDVRLDHREIMEYIKSDIGYKIPIKLHHKI